MRETKMRSTAVVKPHNTYFYYRRSEQVFILFFVDLVERDRYIYTLVWDGDVLAGGGSHQIYRLD